MAPPSSSEHDNNDDPPSSPPIMAFKTENDTTTGSTSTSTTSTSSSSSSAPINEESLTQALMEARELKERAEKERLEAEKLSVQLTLRKIDVLEEQLAKLGMKQEIMKSLERDDADADDETAKESIKLVKKSQDLQSQIDVLKKQLEAATSTSTSTPKPTSISEPIAIETTTTTTTEKNNLDDDIDMGDLEPMPEETFQKRCDAFKTFPADIKALYAKAVGADENDTIETIVRKLYVQEHREKKMKELRSEKEQEEEEGDSTISLLDIANAQAGYSTLPPPIQEMISESVGLANERNKTAVIEKLIESNKVKPTGDFGGVEFAMGDPDDEEENRGKDREFTKEEIKSAIDLFDNLPAPMKAMLANGVNVDSNNSTAVIEKMIEEKKILPSKEGVEFVVFGSEDDDLITNSMEMIESDNYVRSMLPDVMRNDGNKPSEEDADVFFSEVLGRNTFNPTEKPISIPGGYIIRGENRMKSNDELVVALEKALEESSLAGKIQPYLIRDPTLVTEEQFETGTFELPVVMITGTDISPKTNRLVKPLITVLGGFCIASFSVAVCFANEDATQDPVWLEQMVSPLVISILMTQVAHEAAHQIVAFKDKFRTGAPTIVPSIQLGLTGCITPLKTPPPNYNSLFDFAIAGPLVGMIISLGLMYSGLEQQVFMDTVAQSQLPSLPVELLRSSSLAGSMVEWLLGDGVLLSPDPAALIRLHPLAIAGFVGIVSNALSLLPIGNTDGGRLSLSLFGRSVSRVVRTGTIAIIVFSSFFGGDTVNLLLFYTIYAQIWQRESEIPCKNEIENVDNVRAAVALATGLLVALSVIPMM